jgi:hypothetical protein
LPALDGTTLEVTNNYLRDRACVDCLATGEHEFTSEMNEEYKESGRRKKVKEVHYVEGETIFFSALAWKSYYNQRFKEFPYDGVRIENAYFRGI